MPILFKPENVEAILSGRKIVTRRRWKRPRVKVGGIYQARTTLFGKPFARLRVLRVDHERLLGDCAPNLALEKEARREGFSSWAAFTRAWCDMHGDMVWKPCDRIEFKCIEVCAE